jgi:hypothetical protein
MSCVYITANSKFEKYTCFIANSNYIFLICTGLSGVGRSKPADTNNALDIGQVGHLLVSTVLRQPILKDLLFHIV